jgi:outer membrane receptor protein involved in Fe transport
LRSALILVVCLAVAIPAAAQGTTGSLTGRVTDSTGAVLQGVTVTLSGPNIQGLRTTQTDDNGVYRFRNVPPGTGYKVEAARSGLRSAVQEAVQVFLGQEGTVNLSLSPAGVAEAVTVTASTPLVDVSATSIGVNITASQFESLPVLRSFQQITTIAPSVTLEMGDHDSRFTRSPSVGASSAPENNYIIDGLSATDPRYGTSGTNLTMNFVQEVQVLTSGYQAEFGRSTGGVFNVVTRSGGNILHGDLFTYTSNKALTPENVVRRRNKELVTNANRVTDVDFGASVGGPIMRDKLWFFGAIDPNRGTTYIGGAVDGGVLVGPVGERKYDTKSNIYAGKLTWTVSPANTVVITAFGDPTERDGWLGNPNSDEGAALRLEKTGSHNFSARYTGVIGTNWIVEGSYGVHTQRADLEPASEIGRNVPRQEDLLVGSYMHGGFQRFQKDSARRDAFAIKAVSHMNNHELKAGFDVEINDYKADLHETWYRLLNLTGQPAPFNTRIERRAYFVEGQGTTTNSAFYIQDGWQITPNVRANLGLRYEVQTLDSAQDVNIGGKSDPDIDVCVVDLECRKVDGLTLSNNWAPRLGLVWDPSGDGKMKVYGFWGRFYEAIPLNMNIRAINGERYIIDRFRSPAVLNANTWFNPNGTPFDINGPWTQVQSIPLTAITPLDEDLKAQYQDEFVFGGEYQLNPTWSVGVRYVEKNLRRIIEDIGTFTDSTDPLHLTGYVIGNPGEGFFGAPFAKPTRKYRGLEFTAQKALRDNWQLYSSFVFATAKGNHEGLYMSGYDQLDPNITALYDIPSFLPNADGKMRSDKPAQFKVHSAYTFPMGLTISEGLTVASGVPISRQGPEIYNGYGDGTIFMGQRGADGRTPTVWNFDFHADYKLRAFGPNNSRRLSIGVDIFNLFNRHGTLEVDQDYVYEGMANGEPWFADANLDAYGNPKYNPNLTPSSFYKTPILYQAPRSVQIGFKFTY